MEQAEYEAKARAAGWTQQDNGDWSRPVRANEPANETVGNDRRAISVTSAEDACEWDGLL